MNRKSTKKIVVTFLILVIISILVVPSLITNDWMYLLLALVSMLGLFLIPYGIAGVWKESIVVGDIDEDPRTVTGSSATAWGVIAIILGILLLVPLFLLITGAIP